MFPLAPLNHEDRFADWYMPQAQTEDPSDLAVINALHGDENGEMMIRANMFDDQMMDRGLTVDVPRDLTQGVDETENVFGFFAETDGDIFGTYGDDVGLWDLLAI